MQFKAKLIHFSDYDFVDKNGKRVVGCSAYLYDENVKQIIKAKVVNRSVVQGKAFGDIITVNLVPNGRFVKYEV